MVALLGGVMSFASNLRRCREAKGWTQTQAAEALDVPFRTYQNWEGGTREPKLSAVPTIAAVFGVAAGTFFDEENENTAERPVGKRK